MRRLRILRTALAAALVANAGLACAQPGEVETVPVGDIDAFAAGQKGALLLSLTSNDPGCGYCVRHNARFRTAAHDSPDVGRYAEMAWAPWTALPPPVAAFLKAHGKMPAVPALVTFVDGRFDSIRMGELPAPTAPPAAPASGRVPQVSPRDIADTLAQSHGRVVVMLSSFETTCAFCLRANPGFETLALAHPDVRFLRVMYRPWTAVAYDTFGKSLDYNGLPLYLAYQDGRLVQRVNGFEAPDVLAARLIEAK
ncbi:MAG: thioredoxin family protein [Burkholderiaceae bacterium]